MLFKMCSFAMNFDAFNYKEKYLDNAHSELKMEIKQRKIGFMRKNSSSTKFEESSSLIYFS